MNKNGPKGSKRVKEDIMGLVKQAADLTYTFRFIRMLVMDWKSWDAYKLGIINDEGKRNRKVSLDTDEKKSAYTPFIRLAANIKRLVSKIPGGGSKLGSFASALYLIKEKYNLSDKQLNKLLEKCDVDIFDMLVEQSEWFVLSDKQMSPGRYRLYNDKLLNVSCDEMVWGKDEIKIKEDSYPVGDVFGIDIYEAIHIRTNQPVYIAAGEIYR